MFEIQLAEKLPNFLGEAFEARKFFYRQEKFF